MFKILIVDDDSTCLTILKTFLQKWNYEVTAVNHPYDALCALGAKSYDLVLSDVHMPNMNGFQLQKLIDQEFHLPVILISIDSDAILEGVKNGAVHFLIKPIAADALKDIFQYSLWWRKEKMKNTAPLIRENNALSFDWTGKLVWSRDLHTRFVEAMVILGYHEATPKDILDVMNVPGLTKEKVSSHLQRYRILLQRFLDGNIDIKNLHWIDFGCYSSVVSGNPHLMLINQLRHEKQTGVLAASTLTGNTSASLVGNQIVTSFTPAKASSRMNMNATWMPNNYAYSSVNVTANGLGITTMGNALNTNMGDINGGLVGGSKNNMFSSKWHIGSSSTAPFHNNIYSNHAFNIDGQKNNNFFCGQQLGVGVGVGVGQLTDQNGVGVGAGQLTSQSGVGAGPRQLTNQNLFGENNLNGGQLGIMQRDPKSSISFGVHQFGNDSALNERQLGAGKITTKNSCFGYIEESSSDNFLLDQILIPGEDEYVFWEDTMKLAAAEDKDACVVDAMGTGVANATDAENSKDINNDDEYSGNQKDVGQANNNDAKNPGANDKGDENF